MTKTISNVPVRIENVPPGKTVDGMQANNVLSRRANLTITGNRSMLKELNASDMYVVFDASGRDGEWIATITKRNIRSENPEMNISQWISKVSQQNFIIKLTKLVTEKIPILISEPIGEAPKGYQFIDIWPYKLNITVSGPEDIVKTLKSRGLKLTFNLNDISKGQLDDLLDVDTKQHADVVSFSVPNSWKYISLPTLSPNLIEINDPDAKYLRIDFLRYELLKLENPIPISLFFPPNKIGSLSPNKISIHPGPLVETRSGQKTLTGTFYAKGVSGLFLEVIKDMMGINIIVSEEEAKNLTWCYHFVNSRELEDRFVRVLMSDATDEELRDLQPHVREEYLRNRFRNYRHRFQLFKSEKEKFAISPELQNNGIVISEPKPNVP